MGVLGRGELARRFVIGKLSNQRTMLQRYHRRQADAEMRQAIEQIGHLLRQLAALPLEKARVAHRLASGDHRLAGTPLEAILGLEGAGSAAYFQCFGKLLTDQKQWPFARCIKRPPTDPVNALLSFGYALLTNAIKYSPQAETVFVRVAHTHETLTVGVQDFGIGVAQSHQQRLFERFYRVYSEKDQTYPGLGIGLYIAHEIIQRHGGTMWVESAKGKGSTFSFSLPIR